MLEVGIGTGASLPWYDGSLTAIESDSRKLRTASHKAKTLPIKTHLTQMDVQRLGFPSADATSFEGFATVVASLVFCSVHRPVQGLQEIRRVLRPGGTLLLLEHVRPDNFLLGSFIDFANTPWQFISGECQLNRNTAANVAAAGFEILSVEKHFWGLLNQIVARK